MSTDFNLGSTIGQSTKSLLIYIVRSLLNLNLSLLVKVNSLRDLKSRTTSTGVDTLTWGRPSGWRLERNGESSVVRPSGWRLERNPSPPVLKGPMNKGPLPVESRDVSDCHDPDCVAQNLFVGGPSRSHTCGGFPSFRNQANQDAPERGEPVGLDSWCP